MILSLSGTELQLSHPCLKAMWYCRYPVPVSYTHLDEYKRQVCNSGNSVCQNNLLRWTCCFLYSNRLRLIPLVYTFLRFIKISYALTIFYFIRFRYICYLHLLRKFWFVVNPTQFTSLFLSLFIMMFYLTFVLWL